MGSELIPNRNVTACRCSQGGFPDKRAYQGPAAPELDQPDVNLAQKFPKSTVEDFHSEHG